MRELVTWHHDYEGSARQVAKLGEIEVGAILTSESYVQWISFLSIRGHTIRDWQYVGKPPKGEETAKALVTKTALDWLTRAGVIDLAERDRAHAADLPLFAEP